MQSGEGGLDWTGAPDCDIGTGPSACSSAIHSTEWGWLQFRLNMAGQGCLQHALLPGVVNLIWADARTVFGPVSVRLGRLVERRSNSAEE